MAFVRTYSPNADDLLNYAKDVGTAEGSKQNQYATLEGRERQGARAQDASIAAAQFAERGRDRAASIQAQREDNLTRLRANGQDNAAAVAAQKLRNEGAKQGQLDDLQKIQVKADLDARNKSLEEFGGSVPDATAGVVQTFDHALDNQNLYQLATSQQRDALRQKFDAGDPNAIKSALSSGRARLSPMDEASVKKAEAAIAKADVDQTLHPAQRAAVQRQMAGQINGIMRRAEWLPDEAQPKSLQEQITSRVVTLQDPTSKTMIGGYIDKGGDFVPFKKLLGQDQPDPNAPKPAKTFSEEEKRTMFNRAYSDSYKSLITQDKMGNDVLPDHDKVMKHLENMQRGYAALNGSGGQAPPAAPRTQGDAVMAGVNRIASLFGLGGEKPSPTAPTPPTPQAPAAPPVAAPPAPPVPNPPPAAKQRVQAFDLNNGYMALNKDNPIAAEAKKRGMETLEDSFLPGTTDRSTPNATIIKKEDYYNLVRDPAQLGKGAAESGSRDATVPTPKKMEPVYVGERSFQPVNAVKTNDGKSLPIVEVQIPGASKPEQVIIQNGKMLTFDTQPDGTIIQTGELFLPKFDAKNKPAGYPDAVYVHSNDKAGAAAAAKKGLTFYNENGIPFQAKKKK
jgi:hypothetical protein